MTFFERQSTVTSYKHWRGDMDADYIYTSGVAGERFFTALRDEGKILATKCAQCGKTYLPPRLYCETCMVEMKDWIEIQPTGNLEAVTVLRVGYDGTPLAAPEVRGLVRFRGVTGGLIHRVLASPEAARAGARVTAKLKPRAERTGTILDIEGFEVAR